MSWEHWTILVTQCFGLGLVAGMALSTTQMGLKLGEGVQDAIDGIGLWARRINPMPNRLGGGDNDGQVGANDLVGNGPGSINGRKQLGLGIAEALEVNHLAPTVGVDQLEIGERGNDGLGGCVPQASLVDVKIESIPQPYADQRPEQESPGGATGMSPKRNDRIHGRNIS